MKTFSQLKVTGFSVMLVMGVVLVGCSGDSNKESTKEEGGDQGGQMEKKQDKSGGQGQENPREQLQRQSNVDTNVSDEKLEQYSDARTKMQDIRKSNMPEMQQAIKDVGLTMKRYRAIMQQQQGGKGQGQGQGQQGSAGSSDISDEEMQKFQDAQKKIQKLQQEARKEMEKALEESGLSQQEFQRIGRAIQQSKSLQKKMREMQGGQGQKQMQRQRQGGR